MTRFDRGAAAHFAADQGGDAAHLAADPRHGIFLGGGYGRDSPRLRRGKLLSTSMRRVSIPVSASSSAITGPKVWPSKGLPCIRPRGRTAHRLCERAAGDPESAPASPTRASRQSVSRVPAALWRAAQTDHLWGLVAGVATDTSAFAGAGSCSRTHTAPGLCLCQCTYHAAQPKRHKPLRWIYEEIHE